MFKLWLQVNLPVNSWLGVILVFADVPGVEESLCYCSAQLFVH